MECTVLLGPGLIDGLDTGTMLGKVSEMTVEFQKMSNSNDNNNCYYYNFKEMLTHYCICYVPSIILSVLYFKSCKRPKNTIREVMLLSLFYR